MLLQSTPSNARRHWPHQHPLAVLGAPYQVNLEIVLCVTAYPISSHSATSSTFPSPKGEGLCPRNGTIKSKRHFGVQRNADLIALSSSRVEPRVGFSLFVLKMPDGAPIFLGMRDFVQAPEQATFA